MGLPPIGPSPSQPYKAPTAKPQNIDELPWHSVTDYSLYKKIQSTKGSHYAFHMAHPSLLKQYPGIEMDAVKASIKNYHALSPDSFFKKTLDRRLADAGMSSRIMERVNSYDTLEKLITNKMTLGFGRKINKPVTVVIYANVDRKGALDDQASDVLLKKNHHVLYFEVKTDTEIFETIKKVGSQHPGTNFIINGHGSEQSMALGQSSGFFDSEADNLDVDDFDKIKDVAKYLENSRIFLSSCATAKGGAGADNLANTFKKACPSCKVYAAEENISRVSYEFKNNELVGALYETKTGKNVTYEAKK